MRKLWEWWRGDWGNGFGVLLLLWIGWWFWAMSDMVSPREARYWLPDGAVEMDPPPVYATWWQETEACAGVTGQWRVYWFEVPGARSFEDWRGKSWVALSLRFEDGRREIIIAGAFTEAEVVVKHEILHQLLYTSGHPPIFEECRLTWSTR